MLAFNAATYAYKKRPVLVNVCSLMPSLTLDPEVQTQFRRSLLDEVALDFESALSQSIVDYVLQVCGLGNA